MKTHEATTNIKAPADKIWQILTDGSRYPEWDPWAIRIEGKIAAGEKVTAYTKLSPDRAFPVKVTTFEPGRKMVWTGGMPLGLFKGIREFILAPKGDGTVDFTVREVFSGPMLALMSRSLPDMTKPFQDFVNGLKARAEGA
jgi:hypothetical protein